MKIILVMYETNHICNMRLRRWANECLVFRESYDNGIQTHSSASIGVTFFMSGRWLSVVML